MCLHDAARTIKKLKSQNDKQQDCAGKKKLTKEEYIIIYEYSAVYAF